MHFETPPPDRAATVCTLAMPKDTNALGDIFGGWLMTHADVAGAILAFRVAGGRVVTVAVNEFVFRAPVFVGDVVSFYTDVARIGRTSITIDVSILVTRMLPPKGRLSYEPDVLPVASATLTYVHVGKDRRPRPIRPTPSERHHHRPQPAVAVSAVRTKGSGTKRGRTSASGKR
jgi:acyl-CoA thioesterase YciA